jgi:hypothetical protein
MGWHYIEAKAQKTLRILNFQTFIFLAVQFAFGGLFSALTVFYVKSASLFASWPFLLILFGGMIATEYFRKHFTQFLVQLGNLYILIFTYSIVLVPLIVRKINTLVFIISGIVSLILIALYLIIFKKIVPSMTRHKTKYPVVIIASIFVLMNVFYFYNLIPPIPLSLRDTGVYQTITRQSSDYLLTEFDHHFSFKTFKEEYTIPANTPVYFYSVVFAPVQFQQRIMHEWQKKNASGDWVTMSSVVFPIYGGNTKGYRGYSISDQVTKGQWRVLVRTSNGQILGGETFVVR